MFRGITSKLVVIFISVTMLATLITSIVFVFLFSDYAYNEKQNLMLHCAREVAGAMEFEMLSGEDRPRVFEDYARIVNGTVNSDLWVVDADGNFKYPISEERTNISQLTQEEASIVRSAFQNTATITNSFESCFDTPMISVVVPVRVTDEAGQKTVIIGAVLLHASVDDIDQTFRSAQGILFIAALIAVPIAIFVAVIFSLRFTRPLKNMSSAAREISEGNYKIKVKVRERNELSTLATSLNHMAAALDNTIGQVNSERDKLNNIIDNMSDGIAAYDCNMNLYRYNSALLRLCGDGQLEFPDVRQALQHSMADGQMRTVVCGEENVLRFTVSQIRDGSRIAGVLVIVQDISQSERLEKMRNEFVSNVSHEFRTPLTIIKGSIEALMDGAVTEDKDIVTFQQRIYNEVTALEHLVNDLLDISRFKAGKITLSLRPVDMNKLLADLRDSMQLIADRKRIRLVLDNEIRLPIMEVDYDRLRQLFIIFMDNAIKFTPVNGQITLTTAIRDRMALIAVRDTGVGIPEEDLPFLFERFYKVDKARGGSKEGTGLGLSIAYQIVQLHGGTIRVTSKMGKGSCFTTLLPLPKEESE